MTEKKRSGNDHKKESQNNMVVYKPWQRNIINYMTKFCVSQDGIFLYHYMGTGKTLTALGIAQNLGLPFLIVCPKALFSQWNIDYLNKYQHKLPTNLGVISYEELTDFLSNFPKTKLSESTLILDEAHNFANYMNKLSLSSLQKFRKRIVLSATPIFTDVSNLSFIMNIARGKNILPIDKTAFEKKYYKVKVVKSVILGYIGFNIKTLQRITSSIFNSLSVITTFGGVFYGVAKNARSFGLNESSPTMVIMRSKPVEKLVGILSLMTWLSTFLAKKLMQVLFYILGAVVKVGVFQKFIDFSKEALFYSPMQLFNNVSGGIKTEVITKVIGSTLLSSFAPMIFFLFCNGIVRLLLYAFGDKAELSQRDNYTEPDFKKINKDFGTYVSYYKPNLKEKNHQFPTVINKATYISMTFTQILLLLRYTVAKMDYDDYLALNIFKNYEDCELGNYDQSDKTLFLKNGVFIGNICTFKNEETKLKIFNYSDILYYDSYKLCCFLKKNIIFDDISLKYFFIENYIKNHPKQKIVIYSESSSSVKTLSAYLTSKNLKNLLLENDSSPKMFNRIMEMYNSNKVNILILDENYYEGISIRGANVMILLEATSNISKAEQVKARVVRLDSHPPGSKVEIFDLISTMSILPTFFGSVYTWARSSKYVSYQYLYTEHNQYVTPDTIVYSKLNNMNTNLTKFKESLKEISVQSLKKYPTKCEKINCKQTQINKTSECGKKNLEMVLGKKRRSENKKKAQKRKK